jgi:hypothetical protein
MPRTPEIAPEHRESAKDGQPGKGKLSGQRFHPRKRRDFGSGQPDKYYISAIWEVDGNNNAYLAVFWLQGTEISRLSIEDCDP